MNARAVRSVLLLSFSLPIACGAAAGVWSGGGPDLAWVTVLATPTGPQGPLFAGTYGGGLWRSDDLGANWVDVSSPNLCGSVVWSLAYRRYDLEDQLYVGTEFQGLWRTRSFAGGSWDDLNTGLQQNGRLGIRGIAVHPHDPQVITLATSAGVWTSNTGGASWPDSLRWRGGETFEDVVVSPLAPVTSFALQSFALYRSPNKGASQSDIGVGLPDRFLFDLAIWPGTLDELYVVALDAGLYRDPGTGVFGEITPAAAPPGMRNYVVELDATADRVYLGSERGLWSSSDRGASWTLHNGSAPALQMPEIWAVHVLAADPARLVLGSFRDGATFTGASLDDWEPRNRGLRAAWVQSVDAWDGGLLAATAHGRIYLSRDAAASWLDVTGDLDVIRPQDVVGLASGRWLVTGGFGCRLSDDGGATWRLPAKAPAAVIGHRFLRSAEGLYLGTRQGVWFSDDDGERWALVEDGLPPADFFALAVADDGTLAFAANGDAVYLRRPDDVGFAPVRTGVGLGRQFRDLAFRGAASNLLFVAASSQLKLWELAPDGSSVLRQHLEEGLPPSPNVRRIHWDRRRGALLAALAEEGIYRSDRPGAGWTRVDAGIRVPRVEDLAVDAVADRIYVGTLASGVWGADLGAFDGSPEAASDPAPAIWSLAANPLRRSGEIRFELPARGLVRFTLFDLRGRKVRDIAAVDLDAGARSLRWEAVDDRGKPLAAGRYLLRGEVGGRVQARGVTILR